MSAPSVMIGVFAPVFMCSSSMSGDVCMGIPLETPPTTDRRSLLEHVQRPKEATTPTALIEAMVYHHKIGPRGAGGMVEASSVHEI